MKHKYYISLLFLFFASYLLAQDVTVKIVFNNTMDMKQHKTLIDELKNSVNKADLQTALGNNGKIKDKNLRFDIVFFDRNYVGNMKLKQPHVLTVEGYREKWQASVETDNAVLFLFVKEHGKDKYEFEGLSPSKKLADEHLFEKVVEFINENLNGEHKTIVANGSRYLARAITPVWTTDKKKAAEILVQQARYKANHINYFHNSWKSTFLDIKPVAVLDGQLLKVWFITATDTLKTTSVYADSTVFTGNNIIVEGYDYSFSFSGIVRRSFGANPERVILLQPIENQSYIIPLIKALQESKKYSASKKISEWEWTKASSNGPFSLVSTEGLTDIKNSDKFELIKVNLHETYPEGNAIPVIHPWHPRTFCNIFASDLARDILFPKMFTNADNYAPWGAHQGASLLHDEIRNNNNGHFKAVTFDEAWQYTNSGYAVYLTAYNSAYYVNSNNSRVPGHIATCYTENKENEDANKVPDPKVIQAGSTTGTITVKKVWGSSMITNNNVKANLYLGYIIK